jgi:hypothetical protein
MHLLCSSIFACAEKSNHIFKSLFHGITSSTKFPHASARVFSCFCLFKKKNHLLKSLLHLAPPFLFQSLFIMALQSNNGMSFRLFFEKKEHGLQNVKLHMESHDTATDEGIIFFTRASAMRAYNYSASLTNYFYLYAT